MGRTARTPPNPRKKGRAEFESHKQEEESAEMATQIAEAIKAAMPLIAKEIATQNTLAMKPLLDRIAALEMKVTELQKGKPDSKQDYRKTIIIHGLAEPSEAKESPKQLAEAIETLAKAMNLRDLDYDDAFRAGKPGHGKSRPIIMRLLRTQDKFKIFNNKQLLYTDGKGGVDKSKPFANVYINDDAPPEQRKQDAILRKKLKELKEEEPATQGLVRNGRLVIREAGKISKILICDEAGDVIDAPRRPRNPRPRRRRNKAAHSKDEDMDASSDSSEEDSTPHVPLLNSDRRSSSRSSQRTPPNPLAPAPHS